MRWNQISLEFRCFRRSSCSGCVVLLLNNASLLFSINFVLAHACLSWLLLLNCCLDLLRGLRWVVFWKKAYNGSFVCRSLLQSLVSECLEAWASPLWWIIVWLSSPPWWRGLGVHGSLFMHFHCSLFHQLWRCASFGRSSLMRPRPTHLSNFSVRPDPKLRWRIEIGAI